MRRQVIGTVAAFLVAAIIGFLVVRALQRGTVSAAPQAHRTAPDLSSLPEQPPPDVGIHTVAIEGPGRTGRIEEATRELARPVVAAMEQRRLAIAELDALFARLKEPHPDYVAFRLDLFDLLKRHPWLAGELPLRYLAVEDGQALLAIAQAVNLYVGGHEQAWISALEGADEKHRALGLHAFLGRQEGILREFVYRAYVDDPSPLVREQAAFLLPDVMDLMTPEQRARLAARARGYLDLEASERLKEHSVDLLASLGPLQPGDVALVERVGRSAQTPELRMASVRALLQGGAQDRARAMLEEIVADAGMPQAYRDAAREMLARIH